jgi:hypothetical protein
MDNIEQKVGAGFTASSVYSETTKLWYPVVSFNGREFTDTCKGYVSSEIAQTLAGEVATAFVVFVIRNLELSGYRPLTDENKET